MDLKVDSEGRAEEVEGDSEEEDSEEEDAEEEDAEEDEEGDEEEESEGLGKRKGRRGGGKGKAKRAKRGGDVEGEEESGAFDEIGMKRPTPKKLWGGGGGGEAGEEDVVEEECLITLSALPESRWKVTLALSFSHPQQRARLLHANTPMPRVALIRLEPRDPGPNQREEQASGSAKRLFPWH